ncbi:MAG TPA: hypothetical protein VM163_13715 [bacterium]|nr:hypothetical protein [bacterium]
MAEGVVKPSEFKYAVLLMLVFKHAVGLVRFLTGTLDSHCEL